MDAETMRLYSEKCRAIAEGANGPPRKRYLRLSEGWKTLANNEDWLDGHTIPKQEVAPDEVPLQPTLKDAA